MSTPRDSDPYRRHADLPRAGVPAEGYGIPPRRPKPEAPGSIVLAWKLMIFGAAGSILLAVTQIASIGVYKTYLRHHTHDSTTTINNDSRGLVAGAILLMILSVALWVWLAYAIRQGKPWARILGTILFGIFTLWTISAFGAHLPGPAVVDVVIWALGLATLIQLYRPESSRFFRA